MVLDKNQAKRYIRHIALKEIGLSGQKKLLSSKVLVIGVGGLGSPAILYLAAAGVGTIGIADCDVVEISNLQRQIIHSSLWYLTLLTLSMQEKEVGSGQSTESCPTIGRHISIME